MHIPFRRSLSIFVLATTTCSLTVGKTEASYSGTSFFLRFAPGAVTLPSGVDSAPVSQITFVPSALGDSLDALGVTDLSIVGDIWRDVSSTSTLGT